MRRRAIRVLEGAASAAALGAALSATACGPGADIVPEVTPSSANPLDADEIDLLELLNARRGEAGVAPVTTCAALNVAAAAHSDDMLRHEYLSTEGSDGSAPRDRACDAGYEPVCGDGGATIGELVASGNPDPDLALGGWSGADETALLTSAEMLVVGVGRAVFEAESRWTLDLATADHPSCGG